MMVGSLVFSEVFDFIKPIYKAGGMGRAFLYQVFHIPIGIAIVVVTLIGIAFIILFNVLEATFGKRQGGSSHGV